MKAGGLVPPNVGGRIRSYHLLRHLAQRHQVTLFTFYPAEPDDQHPQIASQFHRAVFRPITMAAPGTLREKLHFLRHIFSAQPYVIAKHCRPGLAGDLRDLAREEPPDLILCDFVIPAAILPWEVPCPKVIFTHNVEALIWQRHMQVAKNPLWGFASWREYVTLSRFEEQYLRRADQVLAVSEVDREFFLRFLPAAKISVIPTGVDTDYFQPSDREPAPHSLVFTGAMDWEPNEDGMLYFAREIWPRLRAEVPAATLAVVGRNPTAKLREELARHDGITVTGQVEDIRPYVAGGAVYVVPLRVGSGTRLKIFEAMAMGKAVLSTTVGAEGLPVSNGKDICLADDPASFAARAVELLRDAGLRKSLGAAARQLVESRYSWQQVALEFETILTHTREQWLTRSAAAVGHGQQAAPYTAPSPPPPGDRN